MIRKPTTKYANVALIEGLSIKELRTSEEAYQKGWRMATEKVLQRRTWSTQRLKIK